MKSKTKKAESNEALDKAKEMFNKFDIDNDDHACVIIMFDKSASAFRMVALNCNEFEASALTLQALTIFNEANESQDDDRILN